MTEHEWLVYSDPAVMLEFLQHSGAASERKLRLFACACCRGIWQWMTDPRSQRGVEVAELYADGLAGTDELASANEGTAGAWTTVWGDRWHIYQAARAAHFACCAGADKLRLVVGEVQNAVRNSVLFDAGPQPVDKAVAVEVARQSSLLHCIFGNPFRPLVIAPSVLAWNAGTVVHMAQAIYGERSFGHLPVLADALEEAGCQVADILAHCRGPGPHIRGCWVVDLVLGKE